MKVIRIFQALGFVLSLALASGAYAQSDSSASSATVASAASGKANQKSIKKADRKLGSDVRRALSKTRDIEVESIFVRAHGGAVTLTGSVPDNAQIGRAEEVAKSVPGVTSVTNKLSLQPRNY